MKTYNRSDNLRLNADTYLTLECTVSEHDIRLNTVEIVSLRYMS